MTHKDSNAINGKPPPENGDTIARLLRLAGPRPAVPTERTERVRQAVQSRWRAKVNSRRRIRWALAMLPAAAALAVAFSLWPSSPTPLMDFPPQLVARLVAVTGTGAHTLVPGSIHLSRLGDRGAVFSATTVLTGADGQAAFELSKAVSLRLDSGTRIRIMSPSEIHLEDGSVYIDNPSGAGSRTALTVHTPLGIIKELGTQFEVRLRERSLRVRVREGTVALHRADEVESAEVGTEVIIDPNDTLRRQTIALHGQEWAWVMEIAPKLEIEGRPLEEFLTWISRESGQPIRFDTKELEESASSIVLHGTIEGLSLEDALDTVLPTCGLTHRVSEEKITIGELAAEIS